MAMRNLALALACLSPASQAGQVQVLTEQWQANPTNSDPCKARTSLDADPSQRNLLIDSIWPNLRLSAAESPSTVSALSKLLLAFIPASAFRVSKLRAYFPSGAHPATKAESSRLSKFGVVLAGTVSSSNAAEEQSLSPGQAIKAFYAAFNDRDLECVGSFLTDDCVYEDLLFGPATVCRGKEAFMNALQFHPAFVSSLIFDRLPFASILPEMTLEVDSVAEGTDSVGVEWHVQCGRFGFPLGRGLSQAQFCPQTGKIKRVVDIAEAPWRVVGLIVLPFINIFQAIMRAIPQAPEAEPEDPDGVQQALEQPAIIRDEALNEAALLKGTEELTGDIIVQLEILQASISALGPDHPATLWGKNNLASTLQARGDLEDAESLQREVLDARISAFGPEHPDTLWTKHNLANTLRARGDLQAAQAMQEEVLETRIRTLGPNHPATITIKNNLDLTVEEFRVVEQEYINADADGSGELDMGEFKTLARKLGILDDSEAEQIFKNVDTDGSNTIDLREFTFWYSTSPWCKKSD